MTTNTNRPRGLVELVGFDKFASEPYVCCQCGLTVRPTAATPCGWWFDLDYQIPICSSYFCPACAALERN